MFIYVFDKATTISNLNKFIYMYKEAAEDRRRRAYDIKAEMDANIHPCWYTEEEIQNFSNYSDEYEQLIAILESFKYNIQKEESGLQKQFKFTINDIIYFLPDDSSTISKYTLYAIEIQENVIYYKATNIASGENIVFTEDDINKSIFASEEDINSHNVESKSDKFKQLLIVLHRLSEYYKVDFVAHNNISYVNFSDIADIEEFVEQYKPSINRLYLKSLLTNTEIDIYESDFIDYSIKRNSIITIKLKDKTVMLVF